MSEWQPIETAPDGMDFILVYGRGGVDLRKSDAEFWRWSIEQGYSDSIPSHWMPLPSAPFSNRLQTVKPASENDG